MTEPIVMVPFAVPQVALVVDTARAVGPLELPTVAEVVKVHPLASFTMTGLAEASLLCRQWYCSSA